MGKYTKDEFLNRLRLSERQDTQSLFSGGIVIVQDYQTSLYSCSSDFHFIEKAKGIRYLYASVIKHPDISSNITN